MNTHRTTNSNKTAIGYVRVSTQEQVSEGVSLDAQRDKLKAYCKFNDIKLIDIKADEGISGGRWNAPDCKQPSRCFVAGRRTHWSW
jgi:hypothetical protein